MEISMSIGVLKWSFFTDAQEMVTLNRKKRNTNRTQFERFFPMIRISVMFTKNEQSKLKWEEKNSVEIGWKSEDGIFGSKTKGQAENISNGSIKIQILIFSSTTNFSLIFHWTKLNSLSSHCETLIMHQKTNALKSSVSFGNVFFQKRFKLKSMTTFRYETGSLSFA